MVQKTVWLQAKLVVFFAIWLPVHKIESKIMLTIIWLIKLLIDFVFYDFSPFDMGTKNPILRFFERKGEFYKDMFVAIMSFLPSVFFEYIAINEKMKFPILFGAISLIVYGFAIIMVIKSIKNKS